MSKDTVHLQFNSLFFFLERKLTRWVFLFVLITLRLSDCPFTSPARSGGGYLRQPGANPGERDQLLLVHEPQRQAGGQGELIWINLD